MVFNKWKTWPGKYCGTANLTAGPHTLRTEYGSTGGTGRFQLIWTQPGKAAGIIPQSALVS